jgi:hypothetical protein
MTISASVAPLKDRSRLMSDSPGFVTPGVIRRSRNKSTTESGADACVDGTTTAYSPGVSDERR